MYKCWDKYSFLAKEQSINKTAQWAASVFPYLLSPFLVKNSIMHRIDGLQLFFFKNTQNSKTITINRVETLPCVLLEKQFLHVIGYFLSSNKNIPTTINSKTSLFPGRSIRTLNTTKLNKQSQCRYKSNTIKHRTLKTKLACPWFIIQSFFKFKSILN